eukprot:8183729-Alexandrium_andersonii.AAC.1
MLAAGDSSRLAFSPLWPAGRPERAQWWQFRMNYPSFRPAVRLERMTCPRSSLQDWKEGRDRSVCSSPLF